MGSATVAVYPMKTEHLNAPRGETSDVSVPVDRVTRRARRGHSPPLVRVHVDGTDGPALGGAGSRTYRGCRRSPTCSTVLLVDRRRALKLFQSCAIAAAAWPIVPNRRVRAAPASRPRFYLQIIPQGGVDAVYTTDPKKATEVDPGIDVPYAAKDIVETSGTRLGPSFRALAPWMPRLAIVNAFHQNSANHVSGLAHLTRYKSRATMDTPALFDILGNRRDGEATGSISIGAGFPSGFSPQFLGAPSEVVFGARPGLFEHLDRADPRTSPRSPGRCAAKRGRSAARARPRRRR